MGFFSNPLKKTKKILKATDPVRRGISDGNKVKGKLMGSRAKNGPDTKLATAAGLGGRIVRTGGPGQRTPANGNTGIVPPNVKTGGGLKPSQASQGSPGVARGTRKATAGVVMPRPTYRKK